MYLKIQMEYKNEELLHIRNIMMRNLIHIDRYFEYRDEEPHTLK
jgi:hypothetical protein